MLHDESAHHLMGYSDVSDHIERSHLRRGQGLALPPIEQARAYVETNGIDIMDLDDEGIRYLVWHEQAHRADEEPIKTRTGEPIPNLADEDEPTETQTGWQVTITQRFSGRPVTDVTEAEQALAECSQPQPEPIEQVFEGLNSWLATLTLPESDWDSLEYLELRGEHYAIEVEVM